MRRTDGVDEPTEMRVVADQTQSGRVGQWDVECGLGVVADVAAFDDIDAALDRTLNSIGPRLVRDVSDRAADRT